MKVSKRLLKILQLINTKVNKLENKMEKDLRSIFQSIEESLRKDINNFPDLIDKKIIRNNVFNNHQKYVNILTSYGYSAYKIGVLTNILILDNHPHFKNKVHIGTDFLINPSSKVYSFFKTKQIKLSVNTMNNITDNIYKKLAEGYEKGYSNQEQVKLLTKNFKNLKHYEASRISRTELNSARNTGSFNQMLNDGIEYSQWSTSSDKNVRSTHQDLHGLITKINNTFPNGLKHPGDRDGPVKEWINCRCTLLPFIPPQNKLIPQDIKYFTENDLITI